MNVFPDGSLKEFTQDDGHRRLYVDDAIQIQGIQSFGWHYLKHDDEPYNTHWHRDRFEFHYLIQGSLSFIVGKQEYTMKSGDVFVTFPNELHSTGSQTIVRRMYWFSVYDSDTLLDLNPMWAKQLMDGLRGLKNRIIPVGSEMKDILKEVYNHLISPEEDRRMYASLQMATALYKIIQHDRLLMEKSVSDEIGRALEFIEENKRRNIQLEEVAEHCHLSLPHFKFRFKNEIGTTPAFFIQKQRIECAKELLKQGGSVTQTAHELEFCSSNYFSTVFRRITLMTPTQYIQKIAGDHSE